MRRPDAARRIAAARWSGLALLMLWLAPLPGVRAQDTTPSPPETEPPPPSERSPEEPRGIDPILNSDAVLTARSATVWREGGDDYVLLDGDVRFRMGAYAFGGSRAVVRVRTQRPPGRTVRRLAVYLDGARSLSAGVSIDAEAERLLVTGATEGGVRLAAPLTRADASPDEALIGAARARLARFDETGNGELVPAAEAVRQDADRRLTIAERDLLAQADRLPEAARVAEVRPRGERRAVRAPRVPDPGVLPTRGVVRFRADRLWADTDRQVAVLIGGVQMIYSDYEQDRTVVLRAQNAVVYVEGDAQGALGGGTLDAARVRSVYLEHDAVISDGEYTVRAPRMFFDLGLNKAILLDAVMYTWDARHDVPLYVRAETVRQQSRTSFEAEDALLTTSEFAEPHFAIGVGRVTVERPVSPGSDAPERFTAEHMTLQWNELPFFYWPVLAGENRDPPLRSVRTGYSSDDGVEVETRWDLFALAGREAPDGVEADLLVDYLGDHGPSVGTRIDYERRELFGNLDARLMPQDEGTDEIGGRRDVEQTDELRGFARWQHRQPLPDGWELSLEAAFVSDETFLEEFERDEAFEAKPYETSLFLNRRDEEQQLWLLTSYDFNEFLPQLSPAQTPGFFTAKAPELGYFRTGTDLWDGRLTWFSENRVARIRAQFGDDTPDDRGFRPPAAMELFGIDADTTFRDAASADGFPTGWVGRFDSRQELVVPLEVGDFRINPYAVGRFTGYDDDFEEFRGEDDQFRLWGAVGTRVSTQAHATYDGVESRLFDVHRLRHIVEPSVDVFYAASSVDPEALPAFDYDVESINEGAGVRLGLRNTFETQRGGPGRWRSVDWLVLDTDLVLRSDDADVDTELARFFSYRPEFSRGGDHFYTRLLWLVTDTLAFTGDLTQNLEDGETAAWRAGINLQHTPRLTSFVEYSELDVLDSRLLTYGFAYQLTTKYRVGFEQQLDFGERDTRRIRGFVERALPRWTLRLDASFDEVDDETTFGVVLVPQGLADSRRGLGVN